ncbi:helix-turn-helix domain-containing protein [Nitrincola alkalilacustris]|uniref:helix-turn-helix domain-containing protein n=1 Tax=Nitrincola alkalilacustris TaxID=1571224 RepID=UPI00124CB0A7|nr:helix-turn-helix transcriptional regulator [Nitrincola alkalilacustris]
MSLGNALKILRTKKGMTLQQLAEKTDSYVGNLSRIERGESKPSLDLLYRIAAALDFSLTEIFSIADQSEMDGRQIALNAVFVALLDHDKELLLEFAKLLKDRAHKKPTDNG